MIIAFETTPEIGTTFEYDHQRYRLVELIPYTRKTDQQQTMLLIWETRCPVCDEVFRVQTSKRIYNINRRCEKHRQPGVRVNKKAKRVRRKNKTSRSYTYGK